ncbi:conserved hypothetical protein [Paenibacillus sp. JDR-2]|nr:conserved hypothetical protein [Paenibacillus sp. JDR-2]
MILMWNMVWILVSVIMGAAGQVLLKFGAMHPNESMSGPLRMLNLYNAGGIFLYGASALIWMFVLRKVELSYAYPFVSLAYIIVLVASYYFFGESINTYKIAGLVLIVGGIAFISRA